MTLKVGTRKYVRYHHDSVSRYRHGVPFDKAEDSEQHHKQKLARMNAAM